MGPSQNFTSFSTAKETVNKIKTHRLAKVFANDVNKKGLISKIHKQFIQPNNNKKNHNTIGKQAEDLNRQFSKEQLHMAKRHMKRCSALLIIRKLQCKTTVRYHLTAVRMAIVKKPRNAGECGEREPCYTVGGNVNWCNHCGIQYGVSSEN